MAVVRQQIQTADGSLVVTGDKRYSTVHSTEEILDRELGL